MKILYVSNALMPRGNAASHRVGNNYKLFESIGIKVDLIANFKKSEEVSFSKALQFDECEDQYTLKNQFKILGYILKNWKKYTHIIFYNYPVFTCLIIFLFKPFQYKTKIILDITEWYEVPKINSLKLLIKKIDVYVRNVILFKFSNKIIITSDFYEPLKKSNQQSLNLPTLFDKNEFNLHSNKFENKFLYFGNPFSNDQEVKSEKEKIKLLADEIEKIRLFKCDFYGVSYDDFKNFYDTNHNYEMISFKGKVDSEEIRKILPKYLASIIIRDDKKLSHVGFPSKLAESLMAGTPVICSQINAHNRFKNIEGVFLVNNNKISLELSDKNFIDKLQLSKENLLLENNFFYDWRNFKKAATVFFNSNS